MRNKNIIHVALVTLGILLIPLVGRWPWTLGDFVFMGTLLFGAGLAYEFVASRSSNIIYRYAALVAVGTALLLVYVNAAVGIIGDGDLDSPNGMYLGVVLIGFIGAIIARLKPRGMSRTLFSMAFATALVPVITLIFWKEQLDLPPGMLGVFILNTIFVALFIGSALLFRRASIR